MQIPHRGSYLHGSYTNAGLKPDAEKVRAPHDLDHLRRFIGMVKYLLKFDYSLTTKCEPLNKLTWKDQVFQLAEVQLRAFEDMKPIANTLVLTYDNL